MVTKLDYEKATKIATDLSEALGDATSLTDAMAGISLFLGATLEIADDNDQLPMVWAMLEGVMIRGVIGNKALEDPFKAMRVCDEILDHIQKAYDDPPCTDSEGNTYKIQE
ncbi:MAG: hypothetical protein WCS17_09880 [Prevotella sp.]